MIQTSSVFICTENVKELSSKLMQQLSTKVLSVLVKL
jgi:hypothetical protein